MRKFRFEPKRKPLVTSEGHMEIARPLKEARKKADEYHIYYDLSRDEDQTAAFTPRDIE